MVEWLKKNKISIFLVLLLVIVLATNILPINNIFGQINPNNVEDETQNAVKGVINSLLQTGMGVLGAPIAGLVNFFIAVIFGLLYAIFVTAGISGSFAFPFPDQIVFNKIGFFDPNFINPNTVATSPVAITQGIITNMYYSFFILAGTLFVIAAIVIGIKMAISSVASEKAQYKKAIVNWLMGLVLLFTVHFLMAGIFAVNEKIVEIASVLVDEKDVVFEFSWLQGLPLVGNTISNVLKLIPFVGDAVLDITTVKMYGYGGMILMFAWKAFGGDFISSIICGMILGQTVALVVMYTKRVFYCIILGVMAPLIIVSDVIKKSMS